MRSGRSVYLWIAAGVETAGLIGVSLCALLSPPTTLSIDGVVDVVGSSFVTVAPIEIEINYVGVPVHLENGQHVRIVYMDAGARGWSALSITMDPGQPSSTSATYVTPDGRDYQQKQAIAWFTRAGLWAGLTIAVVAAIGVTVLGLRLGAPALAIAAAAGPWSLLGTVSAINHLASLPANRPVEDLTSLAWIGAAVVTLVASAVGSWRHEPRSRILLGAIALVAATSVAWCAGWIFHLSDFSGLALPA